MALNSPSEIIIAVGLLTGKLSHTNFRNRKKNYFNFKNSRISRTEEVRVVHSEIPINALEEPLKSFSDS